MSDFDIVSALKSLHLTQTGAAELLGVDARTVRRWVDGAQIPGPVEQALLAWQKLADHHLPWRGDSIALPEIKNIHVTLARVQGRGGPATPWKVDLEKQRATLGPMEVAYRLRERALLPTVYTRKDKPPELVRDRPLIEDAIFCISAAMKKHIDAVTLVRAPTQSPAGRWRIYPPEEYDEVETAVARACELLRERETTEIEIRTNATNEVLWSAGDLVRESQRRNSEKLPHAVAVTAQNKAEEPA